MLIALTLLLATSRGIWASSIHPEGSGSSTDLSSSIQIICHHNEIDIKIPTEGREFYGMIYPQGLSKNSSCLKEYTGETEINYKLPLRSCNTMTMSIDEKNEEYYNNIVLEPHPKLVTGHGKGFHVRCKYKKDGPPISMKISRLDTNGKEFSLGKSEDITDNRVYIGEPIQIQINVHSNESTAFMVTNCKVRDGLGWAEEELLNKNGCPSDGEIMPPFVYKENEATVRFPAHKFPYSPTVYYSCQVKLCNGCLPPVCQGQINLRRRRDAEVVDDQPATIQVYNGLWVNEESDSSADLTAERKDDVLCFKQRDFALAIAFSGLFLMIAVLVLIFILCIRRRNVKGSESGSSIYSGGYTNTAYSHSS